MYVNVDKTAIWASLDKRAGENTVERQKLCSCCRTNKDLLHKSDL